MQIPAAMAFGDTGSERLKVGEVLSVTFVLSFVGLYKHDARLSKVAKIVALVFGIAFGICAFVHLCIC